MAAASYADPAQVALGICSDYTGTALNSLCLGSDEDAAFGRVLDSMVTSTEPHTCLLGSALLALHNSLANRIDRMDSVARANQRSLSSSLEAAQAANKQLREKLSSLTGELSTLTSKVVRLE